MLVLDEPTNDLDVETLELLEDMLIEYPGTVLLVSHDRTFLNNVVTSTLVLEGDGKVAEYVGGYDDWMRQRRDIEVSRQEEKNAKKKKERPAKKKPVKLNFYQKRELKGLPALIEQLEERIAVLHEQMAEPSFYKQDGETISKATAELDSFTSDLENAYGRWEELTAIEEL